MSLLTTLKSSKPASYTKGLLKKRLSGLGTLEIVIIIAILLAIALLFHNQITKFATNLFKHVFNDGRFKSLY